MPRVIYSMANDGLIFKFLGKIMPRLKSPFVASIAAGLIAGVLSSIFNLNELVDMMSIGTLMAYSLVSICVLILRYKPPHHNSLNQVSDIGKKNHDNEKKKISLLGKSNDPFFKRLFLPSTKEANLCSYRLVNFLAVASSKNFSLHFVIKIILL